MAAAPTATKAPVQASNVAKVPFRRGSGKGQYVFYDKSGLTLTTNTQDLGPIDIKAYDYMRSIVLLVETTAAGTATAGTTAADGPFNLLTNIAVKQPNGQTMFQVSSGYHLAMIQKYGMFRRYSDPRAYNDYAFAGGSAPTATFMLRIPFELDLRDALGALPNKDAAAPFTLEMTLNTLTNVFPVSTTSPTFRVRAILEAYDQPPATLDGESVQTQPPNMNTLQRWTEQNITMSSGQFDARVRKLGNYVRELIPVMKNSSGVRVTDWADPVQIVLDEDVKTNLVESVWKNNIYEVWGYGANATSLDAVGGLDTGVYPINYFNDERSSAEDVDSYLPTIESEDYLLRGNWGANAAKLVMLIGEVLPAGDIFS